MNLCYWQPLGLLCHTCRMMHSQFGFFFAPLMSLRPKVSACSEWGTEGLTVGPGSPNPWAVQIGASWGLSVPPSAGHASVGSCVICTLWGWGHCQVLQTIRTFIHAPPFTGGPLDPTINPDCIVIVTFVVIIVVNIIVVGARMCGGVQGPCCCCWPSS